ncbi:MAG TPA: VWA domain-containing protein [Herpetosiphonaceae bacterium]
MRHQRRLRSDYSTSNIIGGSRMRRSYRRQSGQSMPLIALMLVVIIAMVGLSVDVGNAYGQQRRMQNAANAGALAGMNSVIINQRNQDVWANIQRTMAGNRVDNVGPDYSYRADYILENGSVVMLGTWNGSTANVPNGAQNPPNNIVRLQVTITERVGTYFARVIGRNDLTVNANGNACIGGYRLGVYPLGVPHDLIRTKSTHGHKAPEPYHRIYRSNGTELPMTDPNWGVWDRMKGMTVHLPVENWDDAVAGTHISWLSWTGGNGASELDHAMTYPGRLQDGFTEGVVGDPSLPNTKPLGQLTLGDWINGDTGAKSSLKDELDALAAKKRDLILPMYDIATKVGGISTFHVIKMGVFRMKDYSMTASPKYINLQYLGDAKASPSECASEPNPDDSYETAKRFNVDGTSKVNRVWSKQLPGDTTYDIVLVMDTSESMGYDWNDRRPGTGGYQYPRLNDAKQAIVDFVQGYDLTSDPDARVSFVTFAGTGNNAAKTQVSWTTSGCTPAQITGNACTPEKRWNTVQAKAKSMTATGYTPGPQAFEAVESLLRSKRTPPAGKQYRQIVLFATDGVFNVCGSDRGAQNCPYGELVPFDNSLGGNEQNYLNNPSYNMVSGRPVWQGQQVSSRIKNSGARVFVVALTPRGGNFDPAGLPEMSSGTGYYYEADDGGAMANIYATIKQKMDQDTCQPMEVWQPAEGAQIKLTQPHNPTFIKTTVAYTNGQWRFVDLEAGQYVVKSEPLTITSREDGKTRKYSRVRNGLNLSEEQQASVYINPQFPNGATVYTELLMSLPLGPDNVPLNGCNTP